LEILPDALIEFRRTWAPLTIVAAYCVALLVPALMPSVQAKNALPPLGATGFADMGNFATAEDGRAA
jgi:hypothetical protein